MRLEAFLALPGQQATDLARKCNVAVSTITRLAKGQKAPSMRMAERIRSATNGAVRPDDFLPPFEADRIPAAAE